MREKKGRVTGHNQQHKILCQTKFGGSRDCPCINENLSLCSVGQKRSSDRRRKKKGGRQSKKEEGEPNPQDAQGGNTKKREAGLGRTARESQPELVGRHARRAGRPKGKTG